MDTDRTVVVARFSSQSEAYIAKGLLEANGIDCFLQDEYINQTFAIFNPAFGGIKLCVMGKDMEAAYNLLKENGDI
ncbi:MAG: DUF2007 domain-containing protein [Paludibacteraceae bacterium]|nr:DUF2007 domain-containing protein [Prevotellaceae bacterium]